MELTHNLRIIDNKKIGESYYKLVLRAEDIARIAKPGQFILIKVKNGFEPLLRRPFSIHKSYKSTIEVIYKIVGVGTKILSNKRKGEIIDVLGPLGKGFDLSNFQFPISNFQSLIVGGGYGIAPLYFLAKELMKRKIQLEVLIGAKDKNSILCENDFLKIGTKPLITTEDGSKGNKGVITDLLNSQLSTIDYRLSTIYACGPMEMLKKVSNISKKYNVNFQVSLEEKFACGIGICLGCVIKTTQGNKRVCKDGPVFLGDEINF